MWVLGYKGGLRRSFVLLSPSLNPLTSPAVMQKLGAHTATNDPMVEEKVKRVAAMDADLQALYDAVSEYLVAVSVLQSSSTKVAEIFESIIETKDPRLKGATKAYVNKNRLVEKFVKDAIAQTCIETVVRPAGEKLKEIPKLKEKVRVWGGGGADLKMGKGSHANVVPLSP